MKATDKKIALPDALKCASFPFIRQEDATGSIMADVLIALTPAFVWAVYMAGMRVITLTLISVLSCLMAETGFELILRRKTTIKDLSACVTGVLLVFCMPVSAPLWLPALGAFFAITVKQAFGGIGKNLLNPALSAALILWIIFPGQMNRYIMPGIKPPPFALDISSLSSFATPLQGLKETGETGLSLVDLFIGNIGGSIGELSVLLIIGGGIYLVLRKIISLEIPVSFLAGAAAFAYILCPVPERGAFIAQNLFSGGIMLGAVIMANDYATCPITKGGRIIYGIMCGALTIIIRRFSPFAEGVAIAILLMNLLSRPIDTLIISGMPPRIKSLLSGGGKRG